MAAGDWIPVRVTGRPDDEWCVMGLRTNAAFGPVGTAAQARAECEKLNACAAPRELPRVPGTTPDERAAAAAQRAADRVVAAIMAEAAASGVPDGPATYNTAGTTTTTAEAPDLDELLQTVRQFRVEQARIDAGMAKALRDHIAASGQPVADWADRFGVRYGELFAVLYEAHPISGRLWDGIRRHFESVRAEAPKADAPHVIPATS